MPTYFRADYRAAGLTSSRELQGGLVAGPTPFVASLLLLALNSQPWLVAGLIVLAHLMTISGLFLARPILTRAEVDDVPAHRGLRPTRDR